MAKEIRQDIKFFTCLFLAFTLMAISLFIPPVGVITESVLYAAIILMSLGGLAAEIDVKGIIHELNELKRVNNEPSK